MEKMVSIILCTYNRAHTLKATIDSILNQTYKDFELIIVDDGSTDSTQELLKSYHDERIHFFVFEDNQYYCAAANWGIKQAKGEYIAFATSDDTWESEKLELQMNYLKVRKECGACFTFADIIDEKGEPAGETFPMFSCLFVMNYHTQKDWIQHFYYRGNCLCHPSVIVRKEVMDDIGDYNLLYCQTADMDLWLRIVRKYPIHVMEKTLVHYRCYKNSDNQVSGTGGVKFARHINELMLIRRKLVNELSDEELIRFFSDQFRNKDAAAHKELEIERAFLLLHCADGLEDIHILGIEKFEEILHDSEIVEILKSKYQVSLQDIYKWNLGHFFVDFGIREKMALQEQEKVRMQEEFRQEKALTGSLQQQRTELNEKLQKAEEQISKLQNILKQTEELMKEQSIAAQRKICTAEKDLLEMIEKQKETEILLRDVMMEKLEMEESRKNLHIFGK